MTTFSAIWRRMPRSMRAGAVGLQRLLTDRRRANRAALVLLLTFAALWTLSAVIQNLVTALSADMIDEYWLSRVWRLTTYKHPPLITWITGAWFAVMPVAPWAFYLLSFLNAALGMGAVWLAAGYVVDARRRAIAVAMLGLLPVFTFLAATFNHNPLQLSLWPLVALTFLLSIERRHLWWSVLFGVASGVAILGKYYAVLIILACALAAPLHHDRRSYFRSARPYLAAAVCIVVLVPHIVALARSDATAVRRLAAYAVNSPLAAFASVPGYFAAYFAYLIPVFIVIWLWMRPPVASLVRGWPPIRRVVACIALAPVVLPAVLLPWVKLPVHVSWMIPAFFFAPLALVSAPSLFVGRRAVAAIVGTTAALAILCAVFSPLLMIVGFLTNKRSHLMPYAALAQVVTKAWRENTGQPLRRVTGSWTPASAISFYSSDHPTPLALIAYRDPTGEVARDWQRSGMLGVCEASETECNSFLRQMLPAARKIELVLPIRLLWMARPPAYYVVYLSPAKREDR